MTSFITFGVIAFVIVILILVITYFINPPTNDYEKHSAYECGFEPFGDARSFFDIHFYTIGLLFIIFDLEVVFLIPAVVNIADISLIGYINFIIFILVVLIGFYYEWSIGLLS
jgi:NADH:ubiquinone oxidoreductase subunit 3 (subunit A)